MTTAISIFTFFALTAGLFLLLQINPIQIIKEINWGKYRYRPKSTMRKQVEEARGTRKYNPVTRQFVELRELLESCGREDKYHFFVRLSVLAAIVGGGLGLLLQNPLLMPVLALLGCLVPIWYMRFWAVGYKRMLNAELETALSIITSSYMRAGNLTLAIEENIGHINSPVREVFERYLIQTKYIDSNVVKAIRTIQHLINHPIYAEWCDNLILCQSNNELMDILGPTIAKLSDTRSIQNELDAACYNAIRETVMLIVLVLANIPLMYFLNRVWFNSLMFTLPGKIILALTGCCIIFAIFRCIRVTRPIEYRR